jgi:pimeloyl-ACP methyl ester carboxylesterase
VPDAPTAYSTEVFVEDLAALLRHLGIARADLVGLSMGANIALSFAVKHPAAVASLTIVGCGSGSVAHDAFLEESERLATVFEKHGAVVAAARIAQRANRRVYAAKDPEGFAEFIARLGARSAHGAAATIRGVLMTRPTLFEMEDDLRRIEAPMLIIAGDRDDGALEPSIFLRRTARHGSLVVLPFTGHTPNLEEPLSFNTQVADFLAAVARGRWAE